MRSARGKPCTFKIHVTECVLQNANYIIAPPDGAVNAWPEIRPARVEISMPIDKRHVFHYNGSKQYELQSLRAWWYHWAAFAAP